MQTRLQARQARAAAAAAAQPTLTPTTSFTRGPSPFSSTLSTLTPSSSSFVVEVESGPSNQSMDKGGDKMPTDRPLAARMFGLPYFPAADDSRAFLTPSNTVYYPPEVFETPRRAAGPTDKELRTAEWARDMELARDERMRLTRTGTLLVPDGDSEPLEPGKGLGIGLGSAFVSPESQIRSTSSPNRALRRVQIPKIVMRDLESS